MKLLFACLFAFVTAYAQAGTLKIITSTADLAAITKEVGSSFVEVESIAKGTQDPHYIEPKPSYMVKTRDADLVIAIGLSLEIGWLPSIIQGSRNPKVNLATNGYLEVGPFLNPLEKASGTLSRAQGDIHPDGNPHITLDPIRDGDMAVLIAKRLGELDNAHANDYLKNAQQLQNRLLKKTEDWKARIEKTTIRKVITFHKTLTYFFDRFNLQNVAFLEPLPGIPPTPSHTLEVITLAKREKVPLIMVENFFSMDAAQRVASDVPGMRIASVPVSVGGSDKVNKIDDLFENLVLVIEGRGT